MVSLLVYERAMSVVIIACLWQLMILYNDTMYSNKTCSYCTHTSLYKDVGTVHIHHCTKMWVLYTYITVQRCGYCTHTSLYKDVGTVHIHHCTKMWVLYTYITVQRCGYCTHTSLYKDVGSVQSRTIHSVLFNFLQLTFELYWLTS